MTSKWVIDYINLNRPRLTTEGIPYGEIYEKYSAEIPFPMGYKSFSPILHLRGLYKVTSHGKTVYTIG